MEAAVLHLYSKSPKFAAALRDVMLKCGAQTVNNELVFPVHARGSKEGMNDDSWMLVRSEDLDHTAQLSPCPGHTPRKPEGHFQPGVYFHHLKTDLLGASVLFADKLPTTIPLVHRLAPVLLPGMHAVVVAAQQTLGKGRSGNVWESPLGCAMFSFPLTIPLSSRLGQSLSFVQHLVATACVHAVRKVPGYEVDLRIKWPNDILTSDKVKVGGVLVSSSIMNQTAYCNVGIGFNVSNSKPTICLNELIEKQSSTGSTTLQPFDVETFIARTLTELEDLLKLFAAQGANGFLPLYMKYWLHRDQLVHVRRQPVATESPVEDISAQIIGLDDYGFLLVRTEQGEMWSVQSDGNRFDMMANLLLLTKVS